MKKRQSSQVFGERVSTRAPVNKNQSAKQFERQAVRTNELNLMPAPQRAGWRL